MKKNYGARTKRIISRIFNVRHWSDWDRMKAYSLYLGRGIKNLFVLQKSEVKESFEDAKIRLNLTDTDLLIKQKSLLRLSILMVIISLGILGYAIYQLVLVHFLAFLVSLVVMLLALVLAFRYHFWYFQIKQHKLGCTLTEWFRQGLMGDKQ